MEQCSPSDTKTSFTSQEMSSTLWNYKVQYRDHKSHPFLSIRSKINPDQIFPFFLHSVSTLKLFSPANWTKV
jgi:hypothetical protein